MNRYSGWTKRYELEFWASNSDDYCIDYIEKMYEAFSVNSLILEYFHNKSPKIVMDVGGGKYGGALRFYSGAGLKLLVDVLGSEYVKLGKIPQDVLVCTSNFDHISFIDGSVNILFSWNTLDHALTWGHFQQGQLELARLLAPGGLFFFHVPVRSEPNDFHIATPNVDEILQGFENLRTINDLDIKVPDRVKMLNQVFTVLTKD